MKKKMKVYICPACKKEYIKNLIVCPRCIRYLRKQDKTIKKSEERQQKENDISVGLSSHNSGKIIILGFLLILLYFAVIRAVNFFNSDQSTTNSSESYRSTDREKMPSLVDWGPLGDSDKEAEKTLNAFFGD